VFQVQVPTFLSRHIFVKEAPGAKAAYLGTFTLATTSMRSQVRSGVGVRVGEGVCELVAVGEMVAV
jgi:hypothetical protein